MNHLTLSILRDIALLLAIFAVAAVLTVVVFLVLLWFIIYSIPFLLWP